MTKDPFNALMAASGRLSASCAVAESRADLVSKFVSCNGPAACSGFVDARELHRGVQALSIALRKRLEADVVAVETSDLHFGCSDESSDCENAHEAIQREVLRFKKLSASLDDSRAECDEHQRAIFALENEIKRAQEKIRVHRQSGLEQDSSGYGKRRSSFIAQQNLLSSSAAAPPHGDPARAAKEELEAALDEIHEVTSASAKELAASETDFENAFSLLVTTVRSCTNDFDRLNDPELLKTFAEALLSECRSKTKAEILHLPVPHLQRLSTLGIVSDSQTKQNFSTNSPER